MIINLIIINNRNNHNMIDLNIRRLVCKDDDVKLFLKL